MFRSRMELLWFLVIALNPAMIFARSAGVPSASVHGVVASETTNQRIPHATVWLCDDAGDRVQGAITNDAGEFGFMGLNAGTYLLKVEAPGYEPAEISIQVSFANERGFSVFLRPISTSLKNLSNSPVISAHELSMPESARKFAEAGKKKLYVHQDPKGAMKDFQRAIAKASDYYEAYFHAAMACLSLQDSAEAEKNLEKAVELSQEKFAEADLALATMQLSHHDTMRGEPLLRRALELNPNSWKAYFELGRLELYRDRLEPAAQAAEKAKELAPEQAVTYRLLSLIHLKENNYSAALVDLDGYIRLDPDSPEGLTAKKIRLDTQQRMEKSQPASLPASKPK